MTNLEFAWISTSMMYMMSAIYLQLRYREWLPKSIPASLYAFGSAIFLATNQGGRFTEIMGPVWLEYTVMLFIFLGWIFILKIVKRYTELRKECGLYTEDEWVKKGS